MKYIVTAKTRGSAGNVTVEYNSDLLPRIQRLKFEFSGPLAASEGRNSPDVLLLPPPSILLLLAFLPLLQVVPLGLNPFVKPVLVHMVQ